MKDMQWGSAKAPGARRRWGELIAVALGSAILGQAMIYHHAAPFVVIFSLLVWQRRRGWFAPFMAGGLAGTAFGVGWVPALILAGWTLLVPLPWYRPGLVFTKWPLLVLGSAAVFGAGQAWTSYVLTIVAAIAAGSLLLFYLLSREIARFATGEMDRRTLVLALASLGCLIAGLAGYQVWQVNPSLFIGALVMLCAAAVQGPAGGAVAGATLGVTLALRGSAPHNLVGIFVSGGFLAGWVQTRHWRLASVGLVLGVLLYAVFIQLPQPLEPFWVSIAFAAVLFQAAPDAVVAMAQRWVESLSPPLAGEVLRERMGRIAMVMREMARAFRVEDEPANPDTEAVQAIVQGVCKRCSLYRACWEDESYRSYRGMIELSNRAAETLVDADDLSGDLARRCIRPDEVARAANLAVSRERERASLTLRIQESRALAERQLTGLAGLVSEMANDAVERPARTQKHPRGGRRPDPLPYRVGVAKRPRRGGVVSGDSELIAELSADRVVFGISDGMGVGPRAAWESGCAMSLMEQLLMAGFSQGLAVRAVNTTLLLRSVEDHFATLDLLLLDREAHSVELVKVAAAPTFVRRRGHVFQFESKSLPVGIVKEISIDPVSAPVEPGDVVVMVTDGVLDNDESGGPERLKQFLLELPVSDPQVMAETILSFMLQGSSDGRDDALVMVILLGSAKSLAKGDLTADSPVSEWRRVTALRSGAERVRGRA